MPSKKKVTYGPAVKERAKRLLEALLAYVDWELEDVAGISLSHKWQDETTKQPKLVIKTQLRTLEFLTVKDKHEGQLTKTQIRQALNDHLKDFLQILEDNRAETQGKEEWHFTLKLWSKDKEKNLEQFEIEWERKRPEKSKQQEETLRETVVETFHETSLQKNEGINWQEICRQNLAQQKQLTTNPFTNAYGVTPQLDEIYVPLAIVERKPPKLPSKNQPEEKEEEKLIPIAEERFFEDVLRQGKSDISQGRKIAIIGEPGSGKTTRLQKIADWILKQNLGLPIWISLADLTQPTITQYIEDIWLKQTGQNLTIEELTQQKHRIWLLLDGLDEMTSKVEMRHVSALLGGWVQAARVVVTCRVNVWEADKNAFSGFDVFRNLEFNPEQVTDYIRRWFAGMGDAATGESLEAALAESENSRLKELIQNPLRLWMLCQIWQTGGGLPETQAGLYGQFVDWVYDWKADKEILDQREAIDTALARLALAAMEQKDEVSRLRLRESWVVKVLGSRPIFLAVMKLGWLNRVERFPEAICVFYHATFQEYFAALAVEDWDYFLPRNHVNFPVAGKEYRIFEPQWKQVILLWLGRRDVADEEKEGFIEKLVNFDDGCGEWNFEQVDRGFYEYRAYFLAAAGISEFKSCILADDIVRQVIKWQFGYFNTEKQEWLTFLDPITEGARKNLPQTDRKRAIRELSQLIDSPHSPKDILRQATDSLGKIDPGNTQVINNEYDRKQADDNLSNIEPVNPEKIATLLNLLETSKFNDIRRQAAKRLGQIGKAKPQVITDLIRIIESTDNQDICYYLAAKSLGEIEPGNLQAITALLRIIETSKDRNICDNAADNLGEIKPGNPQAIAALVEFLKSTENEYALWRVAKSLEKIDTGNPQVIASLIKTIENLEQELSNWNGHSLVEEMQIGNSKAIAIISQIIDWQVQNLGKILKGNHQAIAALVRLIKITENEFTINCWMAESLGEIDPGNPQAIAALVRLINLAGNESTVSSAAESLGKIDLRNPEAIAALIGVLDSTENEDIRQLTAERLGKIDLGNPQAIAELVRIIENTKDETNRREAIVTLGQIGQGNPQVISALLDVLESTEYETTHCYTISSLEEIITTDEQRERVVSTLQPYLSNKTCENNFNLFDEYDQFDRFEDYHEVIWNITQDIPYLDFYRAWHGLTETQTSPLVQTLNLAQLPQLLQTQLTETNLHQTLQLLCIDGSKFDNRDNPAADIYLQLVKKHHCSKSTEGTPHTLTELKIYIRNRVSATTFAAYPRLN